MPLYQPNEIILSKKFRIERLLGAGAFRRSLPGLPCGAGSTTSDEGGSYRQMPGFGS